MSLPAYWLHQLQVGAEQRMTRCRVAMAAMIMANMPLGRREMFLPL